MDKQHDINTRYYDEVLFLYRDIIVGAVRVVRVAFRTLTRFSATLPEPCQGSQGIW